MVTILKRPLGHRLSATQQTGQAVNSGGDLLVYTGTAHGLSDGDYIYVDSVIDSYNGFKEVDSVAYDSFKLKDNASVYTPFVQSVEVPFYISVLQHYWQAVHLPIVYELASDLYPNNTAEEDYVPATVVSYSNNAGYVQLNLSKALTDPTALSKIEIVGGEMAGVYQILTVLNPWSVVIDLVYGSYTFTGIVVKYYDNYAININVYAGLPGGHPWESFKPTELAAMLKYKPDENNLVKFSISDVLKSYIETRNNLTLDTLPNNTDFWVGFYIECWESYDQSDGEEVTTFESDAQTDEAVGYAVNAMLEFKNQHSGHMSDYVAVEDYPSQWLVTQERPISVIGQFFDLSFINPFESDVSVEIQKKLQGSLIATETITIESGLGIIRVPIVGEDGYDEYCVQASTPGSPGDTGSITLPALSTWLQTSNPSLINWNIDAAPDVTLPDNSLGTETSEEIYTDYDFTPGVEYTITIGVSVSPPLAVISRRLRITDSSFNTIFQSTTTSITFIATADSTRISFRVSQSLSLVDITVAINSASGSYDIPAVPAQVITEQICLEVIDECGSSHVDYRITEDRSLRELE